MRLSRFISKGAIFQRRKPIHIFGVGVAGEKFSVSFSDAKIEGEVADDGTFSVCLPAMEAGGPYRLVLVYGEGTIEVEDIYVGDVLLLAGQSNIEFPMSRVKDTYPEEFVNPSDSFIRTFKIVERREFERPLSEPETGEWVPVSNDSLPTYSAIGYFLAKHLKEETGVAVGLINTSLGGSRIESWMSEEMLAGKQKALDELALYKQPGYVQKVLDENARIEKWYAAVDANDKGLQEHWEKCTSFDDTWKEITVPFFAKDVPELKRKSGVVWLAREVEVPEGLISNDSVIWLGTMTDSDVVYINGEQVGTIGYCYPPRRYPIPAGLLKKGKNVITIRLRIDKGNGRITPGKLHAIFRGETKRISDGFHEDVTGAIDLVPLDGTWKYKVGLFTERIEDVTFVSWRPTALFNGMLAPCTQYPVWGVVWYQGESNADEYMEYRDLFERMVNGYRKLWKDDKLYFYTVQLPNFDGDNYEAPDSDEHPEICAWKELQKVQESCCEIPFVRMVVTEGLGEDNDLHPQRKAPIGERLAKQILEDIN